jgi:hypothetical protein
MRAPAKSQESDFPFGYGESGREKKETQQALQFALRGLKLILLFVAKPFLGMAFEVFAI